MLVSYFSPLAPAAILLLSALILSIVHPLLPRLSETIRQFLAPALVGVALLSVLMVRFTPGSDFLGEGLELLSGWNLSTAESVATLTVRADSLSLPFLIVALLLLFGVTLLRSEQLVLTRQSDGWQQMAGWLAIGAGGCWLFVAANGLTVIYAVMAFDVFTAFYSLGRGSREIGIARLFLAIITSAGIVLATLTSDTEPVGILLFGLALWLRLGFYPLAENASLERWLGDERLTCFGLSLLAGLYLILRQGDVPLPTGVMWLILLTMLVGGLGVWLSGRVSLENGVTRNTLLTWLITTQALLVLLVMPLPLGAGIAFAVGLILSLVALWVTPALGKPRFGEGAWSWPYLPALFATLNIVGAPFMLGWSAKTVIYQTILRVDSFAIIIVALLAELLALSGLVYYWLMLIHGDKPGNRRSVVGIIAMVPFLTPGLGSFILAAISGADLPPTNPELSTLIIMIGVVVGAVVLGYYGNQIALRLRIPVEPLLELVKLQWLLGWGQLAVDRVGKFVLRVEVVLEGQHYLGWAIFTALVGALIILLS